MIKKKMIKFNLCNIFKQDNANNRCQEEVELELLDLIPILLDSYEVYKLTIKYYPCLNTSIETLLSELYLRFNPERVSCLNRLN